MPAPYFSQNLTPAEVKDFLHGYERRQRAGWEQSRLISDVICKILSGKDSGITYPWEKESPDAEAPDYAPEEAKRWAGRMEEFINRKMAAHGTGSGKNE